MAGRHAPFVTKVPFDAIPGSRGGMGRREPLVECNGRCSPRESECKGASVNAVLLNEPDQELRRLIGNGRGVIEDVNLRCGHDGASANASWMNDVSQQDGFRAMTQSRPLDRGR